MCCVHERVENKIAYTLTFLQRAGRGNETQENETAA